MEEVVALVAVERSQILSRLPAVHPRKLQPVEQATVMLVLVMLEMLRLHIRLAAVVVQAVQVVPQLRR